MRRLQGEGAGSPGRRVLPVLAALFVAIHAVEARGLAPTWLSSYGDDLLCLPLVLGGILAIQRRVWRDARTLPPAHGLMALVVFSVYFEMVLPTFGAGAVADPLDVLMYLAGFLVFQFGINRDGRLISPPEDHPRRTSPAT